MKAEPTQADKIRALAHALEREVEETERLRKANGEMAYVWTQLEDMRSRIEGVAWLTKYQREFLLEVLDMSNTR